MPINEGFIDTMNAKLPDYPCTLHLSHKANAQRDDLVATDEYTQDIFISQHTYVEEKIDGANCGILFDEGNPVIRNRSRFLNKGGRKGTSAAQQFASIWNWFYDNQYKFEALNELMGMSTSVYGEWMYALHGVRYDKLPALFVPFDIYDYVQGEFIDTGLGRDLLQKAGFEIVPLIHRGPIKNYEQLEKWCNEQSPFASEKREGCYIKVSDGQKIIKRLKMVRQDFIQGCHWSDKSITRNGLRKA